MKKLALSRETLAPLTPDALTAVHGGLATTQPWPTESPTFLPDPNGGRIGPVLQPQPQPRQPQMTTTVLNAARGTHA